MMDEKSMLEKMIVYKNEQLEYLDRNRSICGIQAPKILNQLDRLLYLYYKSLKKSTNLRR